MLKVSTEGNLIGYLTTNRLHLILLYDLFSEESLKPYWVFSFDSSDHFTSFHWLSLPSSSEDSLLHSQLLLQDSLS